MPNVNFRKMYIKPSSDKNLKGKLEFSVVHTRSSYDLVETKQFVSFNQADRFIARLKTKYRIDDSNIVVSGIDPDKVGWLVHRNKVTWLDIPKDKGIL